MLRTLQNIDYVVTKDKTRNGRQWALEQTAIPPQ